MINNSPPSAPAASSATSNTPTAPCSSANCTASPSQPKQQPSHALRDGDQRALAFYFDHRRVHVGDLAKETDDAFAAWVADRAAGLDAIMLGPTRELVADLNQRARDHRLGGASPRHEVKLTDGNQASVGDLIITRSNDRRLRLSATDWVKNGDRWTITHVTKQGDLRVRHTRSHRTVRLPAGYVCTSTGLGYATTIHSAQGVYRRHHARPAHRP